jgi:hypothetical protein
MTADPFAVLGLDPAAELSDDDVRAAWRRIAAATHPDRPDGGDPGRFAVAAAAYTDLRTGYGRGEARAGLAHPGPRPARPGWRALPRFPALVWRGRPLRLAARVLAAASAATLGVLAAGGGPAGPALVTGAATWLLLTAGRDLGRLAGGGGQHGSGPVATGRAGSADHADQEPT